MVLSWVRDIDTIPIIQDLPHEKKKYVYVIPSRPLPGFHQASLSSLMGNV